MTDSASPAATARPAAPARRLFLLRHAKSSWDDPSLDDLDRPLNGRGRRAAAAVGPVLREHGLRHGLVLCSPARRTRETLDLLLPGLAGSETAAQAPLSVRLEPGLYLATERELLRRLRAVEDATPAVLLIGHNPGLHGLARLLARHGEEAPRSALDAALPTGALAVLEVSSGWAGLDAGTARLIAYVTPRRGQEGEPSAAG